MYNRLLIFFQLVFSFARFLILFNAFLEDYMSVLV